MRLYLGIDGGGTKTKFTLCDSLGNMAAEAQRGTCHYMQCGFDGLSAMLRDGIEAICADAGVTRDKIAYSFIGCPGTGEIPEDDAPIRRAVDEALYDMPHKTGNDGENALAGALGGAGGINIVAGTGSVGFAMTDDGRTARCGGWHHAIGSDEGSGYWLGMRLITEFTRQSDGRDDKTPLYEAMREALCLQDDFDIVKRAVVDFKLDRARIASLSALIPKLYDDGDAYARGIVFRAASELCDIAKALYKTLDFKGRVPVSYTGGVFRMSERILAPMRDMLAPCDMQLTPPLLPPDRGAVILAMRYAGESVTKDVIKALSR